MTQPGTTLGNTIGAMLIGSIFSAALYGAACLQTWYYYMHQNDRWSLRLLVAVVMLCDTVQQALIMHIVYTYLVTYFGNVLQLQNVVWSVKAGVLLTNLTAALVQGFLVYRIWKLSNGNKWIVTPVLLLMMAETVSVFVFGVSSFVHNGTFIEIETTLEGLMVTGFMLSATVDTYISGLVIFLLNTSRTGFRRSDTIINRLIVCVVNTGALSSLAAIASSILVLSAHNTLLYLGIFFCIGKLYTNSLLANLNIRTIIHKEEAQGIYGDNLYSWPVLPQTNTTSLSNSPTGTTQDSMPASVIDHCE